MKNIKQRPTKTAGYNFSKQGARRAKRRQQAAQRAASPSITVSGLREHIANATSEAHVKSLLLHGNRFDGASDKTRRQWSTTAKRRLQQIKQQNNIK